MFEEFVLRRKQDGSHWHPPWSSEVVGKESAEPRVAPEQLLKSMLRAGGGGGRLTKLERKPSVAENNESIPFTASVSASRLQAQKSCLKSPGAAGTSDREG